VIKQILGVANSQSPQETTNNMKKGGRSKKTPEELVAGHKKKIEHEVTRIMEWSAKLVKSLRSKKYQLTDDQIALVKGQVITTFNDTISGFEPSKVSEKPKFEL
jgi:hypothetical protein